VKRGVAMPPERRACHTGDGGLGGGNTPVVTTVVGSDEFPEVVTTFVSIAACATLSGTRKDKLVR
jgi:hypothetical protein